MHKEQVFGHKGEQRAVLLDPTKTYSVSMNGESMRLQGCKTPITATSQAGAEWVEIAGDTVTGMYAVRAVVDQFEGRMSLTTRSI